MHCFHVLQLNNSITFSLDLTFEGGKRVKVAKNKCIEKRNLKMYALEIYQNTKLFRAFSYKGILLENKMHLK
jgi:hypothetical protein